MKLSSLVLAGLLVAAPAFAQNAPSGNMAPSAPQSASPAAPAAKSSGSMGSDMSGMKMPKKSAAKKKSGAMKTASAVKTTCMDYAWQSQAEKDCEAGKIKPPSWR